MFNNPYMYTRLTPNMYTGIPMMNAARGATSIPAGMNMARGMTRMPMAMNAARGMTSGGLFSRLGGAFSALKGVNWGGFINNASKTIGVINQTIPLVKQAGPMIRNVKSVMKIASVFKDETDPTPTKNINTRNVSQEKKDTTPIFDTLTKKS